MQLISQKKEKADMIRDTSDRAVLSIFRQRSRQNLGNMVQAYSIRSSSSTSSLPGLPLKSNRSLSSLSSAKSRRSRKGTERKSKNVVNNRRLPKLSNIHKIDRAHNSNMTQRSP